MMIDGACKRLAKAGEDCDVNRKLAPDCDGAVGLICNRLTSKCEPRLLANRGQPCGTTESGGDIACRGGGNCKRLLDPMTMTRPPMGICVPLAGDGQPCAANASDGPTCIPPLRCVLDAVEAATGTCQARAYEKCGAPAATPLTDAL
jgi:hypothetical protein